MADSDGHDTASRNLTVIAHGDVRFGDLNDITTHLPGSAAQPEQGDVQQPSIENLLKSDDFWQVFWPQFWARLRKTTWVAVAGTIAGLAILSTLVFNALRLWDRFFGGG